MKRPLLLAVAAAMTVAGGCSSSAPAGVRSMSPGQVVQAAIHALDSARSVELETVTTESGEAVSARFDVFSNGSLSGETTLGSGPTAVVLQLVQVGGHSYVKGSASFWKSSLPTASAGELADLGSHWVIATSPGAGGTSIASLAGLLSTVGSDPGLRAAGASTILGKAAVGVRTAAGITLWVATTGTSYPVEYDGLGPPSLESKFLAWNVGTPPAVPAGAVPLPSGS